MFRAFDLQSLARCCHATERRPATQSYPSSGTHVHVPLGPLDLIPDSSHLKPHRELYELDSENDAQDGLTRLLGSGAPPRGVVFHWEAPFD